MADSNSRFSELKQKFASALKLIDSRGYSLQNLEIQDNRLLIRVAVASDDLRARLMAEIERADPGLNEVHPDIRLEAAENVPNTGQATVQPELEYSRREPRRA